MAFRGAIFDVDGVLVDSPHELAWREALRELMEGEWRDIRDQTSWTAERFTPAVYQQVMAGKPRMAGARAGLEYFGVPDVDARIEQYAAAKQERVVRLIEEGRFMAFPDALRFILAVKDLGLRVAAASSSKNARLFLERIRLDTFAAEQRLDHDFVRPGMTLQELFDADISGRDFPRGKPDPAIFLTAAEELGVPPSACFVVEDASSGVEAAKAAAMAALGVARMDDRDALLQAGGDLVVTTLDDVSLPALGGSPHLANGPQGGGGRVALVNETHWQPRAFLELGRDVPGLDGSWCVVAVPIEREAHDIPLHLQLRAATDHLGDWWALASPAVDEPHGGSDGACGIADGETDSAVSAINGQQASRESGIRNGESGIAELVAEMLGLVAGCGGGVRFEFERDAWTVAMLPNPSPTRRDRASVTGAPADG